MSSLLDAVRRRARLIAGVFFLTAGSSGCAVMLPQTGELANLWPAGLPERAELADVPFFPQEDYQCGPAALATSLASFGVKVGPEDLVGKVYLPARKGSLQAEMLAAPRGYDLLSYRLAPRLGDLLREVASGIPVVVLQDYGAWPVSLWHYAVVIGYDRGSGELMLRSGVKRRLAVPFAVFEYTWKKSDYWAMVTVPPGRIPATATESAYVEAIGAMERVGRPPAVQAAYAAFLARWPDNLKASIGLANVQHASGRLKEAETVLRHALERHPDSMVAINNLAQTLLDQSRGDEALSVIERAAGREGPFAAEIRETRAAILRRLGKGG